MEADLYVLASVVQNWIFGEGDRSFVIHVIHWWITFSSDQLLHQLCNPDPLCGHRWSGDVLCFALWQSNYLLFSWFPADRAAWEEVNHPTGALTIINVSGHVSITIADQLKLLPLSPCTISHTPASGFSHMAQDALDSHKMLLLRCFHIPTHVSNRIGEVRACVYQIVQTPDDVALIGNVDRGVVPAFLSLSRASIGILVGLLFSSPVVSSSFFAYAPWQMVMLVVLCCTSMPR